MGKSTSAAWEIKKKQERRTKILPIEYIPEKARGVAGAEFLQLPQPAPKPAVV